MSPFNFCFYFAGDMAHTTFGLSRPSRPQLARDSTPHDSARACATGFALGPALAADQHLAGGSRRAPPELKDLEQGEPAGASKDGHQRCQKASKGRLWAS